MTPPRDMSVPQRSRAGRENKSKGTVQFYASHSPSGPATQPADLPRAGAPFASLGVGSDLLVAERNVRLLIRAFDILLSDREALGRRPHCGHRVPTFRTVSDSVPETSTNAVGAFNFRKFVFCTTVILRRRMPPIASPQTLSPSTSGRAFPLLRMPLG